MTQPDRAHRSRSRPLPIEPEELGELTHDAIAGELRIWQRRHGHRYSLDDVLTAQQAALAKPDAERCLELGSGVGSVLLMLCYRLPAAAFLAVEAQRNSFALLARNVADNGLSGRVQLLHADLRHAVHRSVHGEFDLITGTPPYVPPGNATPSPDSQRAFARQELRGGVEDYLYVAGQLLAPAGRVVICADARFPERVAHGAERAGLSVASRLQALPRADKAPLFSVFTLCHRDDLASPPQELPAFVARTHEGARSASYHALRAFFALPAPTREPASP